MLRIAPHESLPVDVRVRRASARSSYDIGFGRDARFRREIVKRDAQCFEI